MFVIGSLHVHTQQQFISIRIYRPEVSTCFSSFFFLVSIRFICFLRVYITCLVQRTCGIWFAGLCVLRLTYYFSYFNKNIKYSYHSIRKYLVQQSSAPSKGRGSDTTADEGTKEMANRGSLHEECD